MIDIAGFSTFNSIGSMPDNLKKNPQLLWMMPAGTPFPLEMNIVLCRRKGHVSIKPASKVSVEKFAKVMSVAHCSTHFHAGTSMA